MLSAAGVGYIVNPLFGPQHRIGISYPVYGSILFWAHGHCRCALVHHAAHLTLTRKSPTRRFLFQTYNLFFLWNAVKHLRVYTATARQPAYRGIDLGNQRYCTMWIMLVFFFFSDLITWIGISATESLQIETCKILKAMSVLWVRLSVCAIVYVYPITQIVKIHNQDSLTLEFIWNPSPCWKIVALFLLTYRNWFPVENYSTVCWHLLLWFPTILTACLYLFSWSCIWSIAVSISSFKAKWYWRIEKFNLPWRAIEKTSSFTYHQSILIKLRISLVYTNKSTVMVELYSILGNNQGNKLHSKAAGDLCDCIWSIWSVISISMSITILTSWHYSRILNIKLIKVWIIRDVSLFAVADCWRWMVRGSNLVKVRPNGRTYNRFFSLDEDLSCIRWVPTSKKASKATGMSYLTIPFRKSYGK